MKQLTIEDIARLARIKVSTVRMHQHRCTLPRPDGYVGNKPVWDGLTIAVWLQNRRAPGRPPTKVAS